MVAILKILGLMLLNAFGLIIAYSLLREGEAGFGLVVAIIVIGSNLIILVPNLYPLRWMLPGLALITLLVIYPVLYTVQNAFTNYGDGHLFGKRQSIRLISERGYVPADARTFTYTVYGSGEDDFALWLVDDRTGEIFFAKQGEALEAVSLSDFGFQLLTSPASDGYVALAQPGALIGALGGQTVEFEFAEPVGLIAVALASPQSVTTDARYIIQATQSTLYDSVTETTVPVTILQRGDEFGFAWETEAGQSIIARPNEPIYTGDLPIVEGYTQVASTALLDAGLASLSFDVPIGTVAIEPIDPVTADSFGIFNVSPQYVYDPVQGLTINQRNGRIYDTTYFQNEAGDYALWLTESGGVGRITRALMILPDQNIRELDITNRRILETLNIRLAAGASIPDRIGTFNRASAPTEIVDTSLEAVTVGFDMRPFDFEAGFVFDIEQGVTIDYRTGLVYQTTVYQSEDGQFALWMDSDTRERGRLDKVLARPDETLILNSTPAVFDGYRLALTDRERAEAVAFLQNIEVDYFGEPDAAPNQRVGIIPQQLGRAGQPFLLRYVFNEVEQVFIDLSSIDAVAVDTSAANLATTTPYNTPGLLSVLQYYANDATGTFDASRLRFVYNEQENAWVDLSSVSLANAGATTGADIATRPLPSIPGFANAGLFNEYAEQGVFAPRGWVYNATLDAFINADENTGLETATEAQLREAGVAYVVRDPQTQLYIPRGWFYNEATDQFINLSAVDYEGLDLAGIDLQEITEEISQLTSDTLVVYTEYPEQDVFAPEGWAYNAAGNAFVNIADIPPRFDLNEIDITTVDLNTEEAFERATILVYDEETRSYVPPSFLWVSEIDSYVDLTRIPEAQAADDPSEVIRELLAEGAITNTISLSIAREPLLYSNVRPVRNDKAGGFIYIPGIRFAGIDLDEFNPATIDVITAAPFIRNQTNSPRISPLVYEQTLIRPVIESNRYILGVDASVSTLNPGYRVNIGLDNFQRLASDQRLYGPLMDIFVWTVTFALLSVFITFAAGLFMAIILNDEGIPGKRIIRSLLIIPYAIPGVIGIIVWQGMLNQNLGIITNTVADLFGVRLQWFTDPTLAKVAILLVNLWLGYPYMMLICSGALQSIPSDVYEAAAVDGAKPLQRFWSITLPLLLVTVGPLLIASFTFNFNNYLLIELLTQGNPPIPGTPTPAGYTDILISYTYNLAFGTDRGAQYGYASAITIVIFALVAVVTMIQFRFTRQWEEVGENV